MNNIQNKLNKIEQLKKRLVLTEFDKMDIRHKMKEYYGKYVNNDNFNYDDYNKLKKK